VSSGDLLSPWFRVIEKHLLHSWWRAMNAGNLEQCVQADVIHRADTFAASAGAAASEATSVAGDIKQGAYGKVPIHKHSILSQLMHVDEVWAGLRMLAKKEKVSSLGPDASPSDVWCEEKLVQVSRSFAMVIRQLPEGLRSAICNFYLALRGLDTVEDDMDNFPDVSVKVAHLNKFHEYLRDPSWSLSGIGKGAERELLESFGHVAKVFLGLPASQQAVIADITARMGDGMALYISRNLKQGTVDIADYNLYCHFVAGLVGEGLSRIFSAAGYEGEGPSRVADVTLGLLIVRRILLAPYSARCCRANPACQRHGSVPAKDEHHS
jgi:hypothetical protein